MSIKFTRRSLLISAATLTAMGYLGKRQLIDKWGPRKFLGEVQGASFSRGHLLLKKEFPEATKKIKCSVAIVGTGVSGLSAAYHLTKAGVSDIHIFELEDHIGGKSHAMDRKAPWGAHYLPLVNLQNKSLLNFLKEIEVIKSFNSDGVPEYDELMICSDPMEKLFIYGRLQDGLIPRDNLNSEDLKKIENFLEKMHEFTLAKGNDDKFAFQIPMEESSQDPTFLKLDEISMLDFLKSNNFSCEVLNWYVNYCTRDDFGTPIDKVSAWAGIHYFAARKGQGVDIDRSSVMTWPEGNSFLVNSLKEKSNFNLNQNHMLYEANEKSLKFYDFINKQTVEVEADQVILAIPQFIVAKVFNQKTDFQYAPWMVANIRVTWDSDLENLLAWDNVNYHGKGIGFVIANHQKLNISHRENILTYYWPLSDLNPKDARTFALKRTHQQWCNDILKDIVPIIPDIEQRIKEVNIWPWGHGMIMPEIGFINHKRKQLVKLPNENFYNAHTDMGGLSLFEEGFYRGEVAAQKVIKKIKG